MTSALQRLVLRLPFAYGDFECSYSYVTTIPITHTDKDIALLELHEALEQHDRAWSDWRKRSQEINKLRPEFVKPYNGNNPQAKAKWRKRIEEFEKQAEIWREEQIRHTAAVPKHYIEFCGMQISPTDDLDRQDITIHTLDEWFDLWKNVFDA